MPVKIVLLQTPHESCWNAYVRAHPQGTLFHTLAWRDAVTAAFGHENDYLLAFRDDAVVGVFPLARVASRLAGRILVSVPYGVYGGVLADEPEAAEALLASAQTLAAELGAQWIDIRSAAAQFPHLPAVDRYVAFRKPLPADPAGVPEALPRKARAAARQARERYQLRVEQDDRLMSCVWSLYARSMRRLASPNYPRRFFEELLARTPAAASGDGAGAVPGHVVQVVFQGDQPAAGLISFYYRGVFMPYFVGCDERFERYHPNNLLYLAAMEEAVRVGCREFDFGRSRADNAGSCGFKRNQGFEPTPLGYQYFVPPGGRAPDLYPTSPKVRLARMIWPRLPLAVTRPLGAWLSRSIPG